MVQNPGQLTQVVGATIDLPMLGSDPEGQPLIWSATGLPAGLSIQPTSGVISGIAAVIGDWYVTTTASDGGSATSTSFLWKITAPPTLPGDVCNRLVNPGFESGLAGWEIGAPVTLVPDSRGGSQAARFSAGWIGSRAAVEAGTALVASVHYKASGNSGWLALGVTFINASGGRIHDQSVALDNSAAYREQTLALTAPGGTVSVRVWVLGEGNRVVTIDDLALRRPGCTDVSAGGCNRVSNGSFEAGLEGWTSLARSRRSLRPATACALSRSVVLARSSASSSRQAAGAATTVWSTTRTPAGRPGSASGCTSSMPAAI